MSLPIIQTIQSNINNLKSTKTDIKNAVNTDYDFIANEQIESYPDLIKQGIAHYKNRVPHATKEGTDLSFNAVPLKFENMTIKGNTEQASLPEGYTALDYIESDGTQYIDTGVNADSNLRVLLDLQYKNKNENDSQIGAIYKTGTSTYKRHHVFQRSSSNTISVGISSSTYNTAAMDTNRHIIDISTSKIVVDNNEYSVSVADFDTELNYWLLGRNSNDASLSKLSKSKLYKCKMWYNNILVRYFIPCKDSNNVVGLYDLVSQTFFENDGTGDFVAGNEVTIPNPDFPQDIHVVTGENTVKVQGKNLWGGFENVFLQTHLGINFSTNKDGTITAEGTATGYAVNGSVSQLYNNGIYKRLPAGTYTISKKVNDTRYRLEAYDSNANQLANTTASLREKSFTLTEETDVTIRITVINGAVMEDTIKFMLEQGSEATDYEPYIEPRNFPINLGDIELCKIGDYQDYLYKENGNWYKYGAINKRILNENGNYTVSSSKIYTPDISDYSRSNNIPVCNYFTGEINKESISEMTNNNTVAFNKDEQYNRFYIYNSEFNTTQKIKQWLAQNNLIVYYLLKNPVITQITDSTLISQLEALDKAKGNNGTTMITTSGDDLAPILNFTAYLKEVE